MKLLPYERVTFYSDLPLDQVALRLSELLPQTPWYLWSDPHPLRGTIHGNRFAFVPRPQLVFWRRLRQVISGRFESNSVGTEIETTFRLNAFYAAVLCLWSVCLFLGTIGALVNAVHSWRGNTFLGALGGMGMFTLFYAAVTLPFWSDVNRAKKLLYDALGGTESTRSERR